MRVRQIVNGPPPSVTAHARTNHSTPWLSFDGVNTRINRHLDLVTDQLARSISSPVDLLEQNLIQSDNKQVRRPDWFALNELAAPPTRGFRFDRSFLAIAMAVDGLGVALESTLLAEREIASGRLVAPLLDRSESIHYVGHYLVSPKGLHQRRPLRVFTQWLSRELKLDHRSR